MCYNGDWLTLRESGGSEQFARELWPADGGPDSCSTMAVEEVLRHHGGRDIDSALANLARMT